MASQFTDASFGCRKNQMQKEFGCPPEDVEEILKGGKLSKPEKPSKPAKPHTAEPKKPSEEDVLKEMKRLAGNGIVEVSNRLISDKLGFADADKGRNKVRRAMKKLEKAGKVEIGQKEVGKHKQYVYRLKESK